jgi:hypothetical protein
MTFDEWWEKENIGNAGTGALNTALEELAYKAWQAATERAAKVCEEMEYDYWRSPVEEEWTPADCAAVIRGTP